VNTTFAPELLQSLADRASDPAWVDTWRTVALLGTADFFAIALPLLFAIATARYALVLGAGFALSASLTEFLKHTIARERLDPAAFDEAIALIRAAEAEGGRVHVTGIGKPEHVAHYAASLLSSTGTPATFLHGTEAVHGSAGQLLSGDVVIAISNSGETEELYRAVEVVRGLGAKLIAVTGGIHSRLARSADAVLDAGVAEEGGGLGFAPRASVAAEILVVAALSAALESERGFTREEYNARHPAGKLGEASR
jgi:arabinose-5-phosphate isomerase